MSNKININSSTNTVSIEAATTKIVEVNSPGPKGAQGLQGLQGTTGIQGPSDGAQGTQGIQGETGIQGLTGIQGTQGIQGAQGVQGIQGAQGIQGIQGTQGLKGTDGIGTQGIQGIQGTQGIQGYTGLQGVRGLKGTDGIGTQGTTGLQGAQGLTGLQGTQGLKGTDGIGTQGATGLQGAQGFTGLQGTQGLKGTDGIGTQGTTGLQGTQGFTGLQGTQGFKGIDGIGIQGTQGIQGVIGSQGFAGLRGQDGVQGIQGITGIGTQGAQGFTGLQGIQGFKGTDGVGTQGTQGIQGVIGSQGFAGLRGDSGTQGIQGIQGTQGLQGYIGGQGVTGSQGVQGITGAGTQGLQGLQGVQGTEGNFGGATFDYTFDISTVPDDPGTGFVRLDVNQQNLSTEMYIDSEDDNGNNINSFLETIDSVVGAVKGFVRITKKLDATSYLLFAITELTPGDATIPTPWWQIDMAIQASSTSSPFANNDDVLISFVTTGQKGDTGAQGTQGTQGTIGLTGTVFPYSGSDAQFGTPPQAIITGSLFLSGSGHITASGLLIEQPYGAYNNPIIERVRVEGRITASTISTNTLFVTKIGAALNTQDGISFMGSRMKMFDYFGNLGIGLLATSTDLGNKLSVGGNIYTTGSNAHITASGNISASGYVQVGVGAGNDGEGGGIHGNNGAILWQHGVGIYPDAFTTLNATNPTIGSIRLQVASANVMIISKGWINAYRPITASSDISASYTSTGSFGRLLSHTIGGLSPISLTDDTSITGSLVVTNNITASGTISASGNLLVKIEDNSTSTYKTVVYDSSSGQLFFTGSYGGSGGSANLTQELTSNQNVGGIDSGDIFNVGSSIEDLLRTMLITYQEPTISGLTVRLSTTQISTANRDVGESFTCDNSTFNAGVDNPNGNYPENSTLQITNADGGTINETGPATLSSNNTITYSTTLTISRSSYGTVIFRVNTESQTTSDTQTTTKSFPFKWRNYLLATSVILDDATKLQTALDDATVRIREPFDTNKSWNTTTTAENQDVVKYTYIVYPSSYGALNSILLNGATPIIGAFTELTSQQADNNQSVSQTWRIYKSNAPGAFQNNSTLAIT